MCSISKILKKKYHSEKKTRQEKKSVPQNDLIQEDTFKRTIVLIVEKKCNNNNNNTLFNLKLLFSDGTKEYFSYFNLFLCVWKFFEEIPCQSFDIIYINNFVYYYYIILSFWYIIIHTVSGPTLT